ncbi:uncharacterized protein LOC143021964 [Oratosquilla oratoria]|uniref:uncharacterized protein LOC143021964 n=1 Tax=Oratosquilla oratoria TaxID=337810 RepID=UPI003F77787B
MKISASKSEILVLSRTPVDCNIFIGQQQMKQVANFQYLCTQVNERGLMEKEIDHRIYKYSTSLNMLHSIMRDPNIPQKVKVLIYGAILRPILTYGAETWTLTSKTKSKVQAAEMKALRLIKGVTRLDRLTNNLNSGFFQDRVSSHLHREGSTSVVRPRQTHGPRMIPKKVL